METWSKKVNREKSAEAIVVRTSCESKKERRAEQFYGYGKSRLGKGNRLLA